MKILVVKTSSMGDIIHALPVTVDIRENLPDAEVHWLSEESFKEIPALSPVVSKVHVCAFRRWRKNWETLDFPEPLSCGYRKRRRFV